ncbi:hypothetical protein QOZ80_9BG0717020 [Eleusine coracana subsp. coracana]|nr:hypothetical protein QOZ80_9BG0717020 [Eleusine coracana subsp. coracana]
MAGADLERVVVMLRSESTEEQFRLLGAVNLFAELRSAVFAVHGNGTIYKGTNRRLMFCVQSLAAPLRELLDAVHNDFSMSADASSSSHNFAVHGPVDALGARMVGRSELLDKMVSIVLDERTYRHTGGGLLVMPIIGGPGIGKTRLAMALLDDHRVRRKFVVRLAVPVIRHRQFSLERFLMLKIIPGRKHCNVEGFPSVQQAMASHITRKLSGVDYLIVLDDVWSDQEGKCPEIGALMKALPSNYGRLVITTRTPEVATYLETLEDVTVTSKPFFLRPLERHFSSSFVAEWIAAYHGDWPPELVREAGMVIAHKCEGVPLLLYYARICFCQPQGTKFWQGFLVEQSGNKARPPGLLVWRELLACINDLPHDMFWQRFLRHSRELPGGNLVLESGSVSYKHLPSDLRSCLLYCSMFPLGYDFDLEELTDLLAAQGYIPPVVGKAQRKGFLQQLLDECFYPLHKYEFGDKCTYRVHNVLHIFAQNMHRETSLVIKATQATQLTSKAQHAQSHLAVRRASLIVVLCCVPFPKACSNALVS